MCKCAIIIILPLCLRIDQTQIHVVRTLAQRLADTYDWQNNAVLFGIPERQGSLNCF